MTSLKGKVAVVTGASRGIGRGIAERLAKDGAAIVVNYTKSADEAEKVVAGIKAHGGTARAVQADVSKVDDIRRLSRKRKRPSGAWTFSSTMPGSSGRNRSSTPPKKSTIGCLPSMRRDSSLRFKRRQNIWPMEAAS